MPERHAILGPSSAYRWLACTPSARFEEQIPEEESEYAAEGTLAHDLAALMLSFHYGDTIKGFSDALDELLSKVIDFYREKGHTEGSATVEANNMVEHAEAWAELITGYGGDILIEQEYDISSYVPLGFGTADATNITQKVLYVSDYKYGAGVRVSVTANKQMMLYGVGALTKAVAMGHKPEIVVLTIFQPRAGGASTWQISVTDLLKWAEMEVKPKALLAISGQGDFIPGSHCQFCKARTSCKAYFDKFEDVRTIRDKRVMTAADTATVLSYGSMLKSWITKVEEEAIKKIQSRKVIPGFKLVAGRGSRKFRNEDNVVDILLGEGFESDQIFNASLRSLTNLEKTLGPKRFKGLFTDEIITVDGSPKIAPEDDDRPAIGASAADDYDKN